ncbi:MAG: excinuclease ABC subunit UvrC [Lachnospiraceae bacterium]|nr:excinuclease ABC subunit UvrC [Lachnospiraceae bacterium]
MNAHFDLKEELNKLPKKPGVYLMHDAEDNIIYVGKAKNLFNRVRSYFRENIGRGPKIDRMVSLIDYFEYIITDTELEALVLENNLIKEHRPKYNTMLMDDKTYPYIKVTVYEEYPRILFSRTLKKDRAKYFGPYTSAQSVKATIDVLNKIYGLRSCTRSLPAEIGKQRPCLNYHIGQCCGACTGNVSKEEYAQNLKGAMEFLGGNYAPLQKQLREKMMAYSENLEFEEAAKVRDLLEHVVSVSQKQKIEDSGLDDRDIIAIAREEKEAVVQIFFLRNGRMVGREHYYLDHVEETSEEEMMTDFIKQFYAGTPFIPRDVYLSHGIIPDEEELLISYLSEKRGGPVHFILPKIGQKEKMVELAAKNAALVLSTDKEKIKLQQARTIGAVHEIEQLLDLPSICRMEAFDISNTSGFENVASMVVFEDGKPKKSDYRKFKMKTVAGPDDYACMREALTRRFSHGLREEAGGFERFPDLLLMDGGRGQVNIALEVMDELGVHVPVCGMVKDDHHRTRGVYFNNVEMPIDTRSEGFKLITRVQDEAHRFAIEYHRSLRSKEQVKSVLDDIPGIGPKRRLALMKAFINTAEIKDASVEELVQKGGIPEHVAKEIYAWFRKE